MARWWRAYDDALHDPKVQLLSPVLFRTWFNVLCIASKNGGILPDNGRISFELRFTEKKSQEALDALTEAGLLDRREDGKLEPHNWGSRQYQSDSSYERVKRHREKRAASGLVAQWCAPKALRAAVYERDEYRCIYCGGTENLSLDHRVPEVYGGTHETENLATACTACNGAKRDLTETEFRERYDLSNVSRPIQKRHQSTDNRTDIREEKKEVSAVVRTTRRDYSPEFLEFCNAYPKRQGDNPRPPAFKKFNLAVRDGVAPETLIFAAKRYAERESANIDTPYIVQMTRWFNERRWEDGGGTQSLPTGPPQPPRPPKPGLPTHEELMERYADGRKNEGIAAEGSGILAGGVGVCDEEQHGMGADLSQEPPVPRMGKLFCSQRLETFCDPADGDGGYQVHDDAG